MVRVKVRVMVSVRIRVSVRGRVTMWLCNRLPIGSFYSLTHYYLYARINHWFNLCILPSHLLPVLRQAPITIANPTCAFFQHSATGLCVLTHVTIANIYIVNIIYWNVEFLFTLPALPWSSGRIIPQD